MSDLPRLLLCSFDVLPGPSGSSRRLTEYLRALPDRFNVVVLSVKTPDHSHIEKYQGARLLRVPVGGGDLASRIQTFERAVRRQLESEEYALVHFTDPFGGYALCEQKADYGYRLVYEAQSFPSMEMRYTQPQTEGDRRLLAKVRRQELFCLMSSDRVVTGSQTTRSYIQGLGVAEDLVRVLRAPVNLEGYPAGALGVPDGAPMRLMYLGSQVGWQGLSFLLRALAVAVKQVDVRLTLVGPRHPDWQPHLETLVAELGLQERVEFQPPVAHDDVGKVLALADVGVLPLDDVERNRQQGGQLSKASEYFAAGRPVLAADLPITRELLPASATVFHPPGDLQGLADRIIELARDPARRTSLGQEGRAFAEQHLDAGLIRGQLLDIYDELLGRASAPSATASLQPAVTTVTGTPTNRIVDMRAPGEASTPKPAPAPAAPAPAPAPDELPLLLGQALSEGVDTRLIKTEPDARPNEPPVVMGLPLREAAAPRAPTPSPAPTPPAPAVPPAPASAAPPASPPPLRIPQAVREPPAAPAARASVSSTLDELLAPAPVASPAAPKPPAEPPAPRASAVAVREQTPAPPPLARAAPAARREETPPRDESSEPTPIVRGTPMREAPAPAPPARAATSRPEPAPATPAAPPPLPAAPRFPSSAGIKLPPRPSTVETAAVPSTALTLPHLPAVGGPDEDLPEVDADELSEVDSAPDEEPEEISNEVLQEADALEAEPVEADAPGVSNLPGAAVDPWFAQLAYGYCPPEGTRFTRHTPPTNFPGRDADSDPTHQPPTSRVQGASRGKAS